MVDVAVVGAGINGCAMAYRLHAMGLGVTVFDMGGIANGGSGAAGAFLSPKFSKSGELKTLINTALDEALPFYEGCFTDCIQKHNLLHIAKNDKEGEHLRFCKTHDDLQLLDDPPFIPPQEYIYTSKNAIVDAKGVCEAMLQGCDVVTKQITTLHKEGDVWVLNGTFKAKYVVLATGAYQGVISHPYEMVRGVWGHRITIATTTYNSDSIHQFVSISPSRDALLSIGATHDVHFHPQHTTTPYNYEAGREELIAKASLTLPLQDVEVVEDFVGLRSGSVDYLPIVGEMVDERSSLSEMSHRQIYTKTPSFEDVKRHEGVFVINGSAGYGFVLAPMLSRLTADAILHQASIPKELDNARFFFRWAKKR